PDVLRSVFLEGAATYDTDKEAQAPTIPTIEVRDADVDLASAPSGNGSSAPRLEVFDISKRFGGINALTDVSFDVRAGEILGFLGPNGAGKTTLFDVLSGFHVADRGNVLLEGSSIARLGPDARARRGLGRSFQDGRLFPALTVTETITVACDRAYEQRLRGKAKRARVDELIELLGLQAFRHKYIRELSTGSRRVVDLACVLAHNPRVLLLDEPSSGIAQREAEALGPLLLRIRAMTGASLLVIEHDVPLLTSITDRMLALDLGEVVAIGTAEEVVHDPRVVASYLGESEAVVARSGPRDGQ
ncbi:MAG TPA: ATP-binding cassette domain-containing protein, partial [Acidimicrobiia bacterium]|nr:ATP-binding cassette domain-containing protein [Acidimicrobiia bacterium]